jgi:hypothetical protein
MGVDAFLARETAYLGKSLLTVDHLPSVHLHRCSHQIHIQFL